jgi:hypothetical protein
MFFVFTGAGLRKTGAGTAAGTGTNNRGTDPKTDPHSPPQTRNANQSTTDRNKQMDLD